MKALLDSSVVVAALWSGHPQHDACRRWLERGAARKVELAVPATVVAESYAVLTGLPLRPRLTPPQATRLLREGLLEHASVVGASPRDHAAVIDEAAALGLAGGVVHDLVIARAARAWRADVLVTLNLRDFRRAWPQGGEAIVPP
jgi:predicted nucleic acid-binding protein